VKALVTGGAGFIGSNLAARLWRDQWKVVVVDNFLSGTRANLDGFQGKVIEGDIRNLPALLGGFCPDVIFHQAAITDTTVLAEQEQFGVNVQGSRIVFDVAVSSRARVVYASSAGVYGDGTVPMSESQGPRPLNAYARSKVAVERMAAEYARDKGLVAVGLRYFNVYGPHEHAKKAAASMIWQLALQMARGQRPRVFKWGEQVRDQVYVDDVVAANLCAVEMRESDVYNVGTGHAVSFNEIISELNKTLGRAYEPDYFDNPYGFYQNNTRAEMTKTHDQLGFRAKFDLAAGLQDYFARINVRDYVTRDP